MNNNLSTENLKKMILHLSKLHSIMLRETNTIFDLVFEIEIKLNQMKFVFTWILYTSTCLYFPC